MIQTRVYAIFSERPTPAPAGTPVFLNFMEAWKWLVTLREHQYIYQAWACRGALKNEFGIIDLIHRPWARTNVEVYDWERVGPDDVVVLGVNNKLQRDTHLVGQDPWYRDIAKAILEAHESNEYLMTDPKDHIIKRLNQQIDALRRELADVNARYLRSMASDLRKS